MLVDCGILVATIHQQPGPAKHLPQETRIALRGILCAKLQAQGKGRDFAFQGPAQHMWQLRWQQQSSPQDDNARPLRRTGRLSQCCGRWPKKCHLRHFASRTAGTADWDIHVCMMLTTLHWWWEGLEAHLVVRVGHAAEPISALWWQALPCCCGQQAGLGR